MRIPFPGFCASTEQYVFLLGQAAATGNWLYFVVALLYKTPVGLLILSAAGIAAMLQQRRWRELCVLWLMPLTFFMLGSTGILTIGFRHFLPAMPFLILLAGNSIHLVRPHSRHAPADTVALGLLTLWFVVSSLRIYPHQEAYFNELAGPWTNWSRILVDSNIDWGQDLPTLRTRMEELGIDRVNLAYFGKAVPEKYGVNYTPLPSFLRFIDGYEPNAYNPYTPEPGWYAISATSLRLGLLTASKVDLYAYFRDLKPDARAGYSLYLYNVTYPLAMEVTRTVVTGAPVANLSAAELGVKESTRVQAKWRTSDAAAVHSPGTTWAPPQNFVAVNANFAGIFLLDGYTQPAQAWEPGGSAHLDLVWRRGGIDMPMPAPTHGRPLSAFVQLIQDETGAVVAQFDGWDVALRGLEAGDIVEQKVELNLPDALSTGKYSLWAGLYSPQSGVRLSVENASGPADSVQLMSMAVP